MVSFEVATRTRTELVDVTAQVHAAVASVGVESGTCLVCVPHTTAGVCVNEAFDPDVAHDICSALSRLVPHRAGYAHAEGNADAHIKAVLVGSSQAIPVERGRLALGRWQGVFLCEFDGPRPRRVHVKVTSDSPPTTANRNAAIGNRKSQTGG
jgi:secondary thiamine-phosphate synthase enzyme